ncbi:sugar ABC transporter substrate-binding protein [Paenibacillus beijingensis]|uniref:LacI family transcriptional regulator n=1 Tax=Paenibacillus beijingensis TaxID=1126833 RepID=A0A0D5NPV1_9BACL|nr:sugar ABC transporter substrate-binding protein [Paenibacillus beijingensis]AJY77180.1 LacI family transcriptional regulator [Paenibacillus beijingensis]
MNKWGKRALLLLAAAMLLVVSACGNSEKKSGNETNTGAAATAAEQTDALKITLGNEKSLEGKKIALVMQFNQGTFSAQYIAGVEEQVKNFGGTVQVFVSDNDLAKMASNLDSAINGGFDAILTDHGTPEALQAGVKKAVDKGIPVVSFDADLNIPGVTVLQQDDQKMAELTLNQLKADIGGKGNIVKIWVAGFAPMERRQIAYKSFLEANPDIKEIAAFGDANNAALNAQTQMEAILKQNPEKGSISAVWASWDEFAKGATRAIQQAGRNEIKVYGIDMSDEDLQLIQDKTGPWVASAAVDPKDIGRVQVRYLYQKLHGDKTEDKVVLNAVNVSRDQLPDEKINTAQLSSYVKEWGSNEQGIADWMVKSGGSAAK